jgi:hypothetical protein
MRKRSADKDSSHLVYGIMLTGKWEITFNRSSALFFDYLLIMEAASCSKTSRTIQVNFQASQSCSVQTTLFLNFFKCQKTKAIETEAISIVT